MLRKLFTVAAIVSFLLLGATAGVWFRHLSGRTGWQWTGSDGREQLINVAHHRLVWIYFQPPAISISESELPPSQRTRSGVDVPIPTITNETNLPGLTYASQYSAVIQGHGWPAPRLDFTLAQHPRRLAPATAGDSPGRPRVARRPDPPTAKTRASGALCELWLRPPRHARPVSRVWDGCLTAPLAGRPGGNASVPRIK